MMMFRRMPSHAHRQTTVDVSPIVTKKNARRDLRGAQLRGAQLRGAQWRGSVELKCGAKLKSGARRGGGEQALIIPGIAISVDF